MSESLVLKFIAMVPVGSSAVVLRTQEKGLFGGWSESDPIVIDQVTGIVYGSEWVPAEFRSAQDDLDRLSEGSRRFDPARGREYVRIVSCLVRSKGWGEQNSLSTVLGIAAVPPQGAYR